MNKSISPQKQTMMDLFEMGLKQMYTKNYESLRNKQEMKFKMIENLKNRIV